MNNQNLLETEELAVETFPVSMFGSNCTIIYSKSTQEAIVIDAGLDFNCTMGRIKQLNLDVTMLLHTHAHLDHAGHSSAVKKETGAPLYMHADDELLYSGIQQQGEMFGVPVGQPLPLDYKFASGDTFGFEKAKIPNLLTTIHTPGHSPGSCCFYCEAFSSPLLIAGDTLFQHSIGRTDLPGGDMATLLDSIKSKLFILPEQTVVVTGHGPNTTIGEEMRSNPFLT